MKSKLLVLILLLTLPFGAWALGRATVLRWKAKPSKWESISHRMSQEE